MRMVLRLIRAHLWERPVRTVLTALATACATCLVVWVVSGYEAVMRSMDLYASRALGRYVLVIDPVSRKPDRAVPSAALALLRQDPAVLAADSMWAELTAFALEGGVGRNRGNEAVLVGTDAAEPPFALVRGRWIAGDQSESLEVALSAEFAADLKVDVGGTVNIPRTAGALTLTVVGIVDNPPDPVGGVPVGTRMLPSPSVAGAFVSERDAVVIHQRPAQITFIAVAMKPGADVHAVRYAWGPKLNAFAEPAQVMTDYDLEEEMEEQAYAGQVGIQMWVVTAVAGVLAFLVVFSTLTMGVSERVRQFALLRAVVLTKGQLAALIAGEGLALTGLGLVFGLVLGWVVVESVGVGAGRMLRHGADVGWFAIVLAALIAGGAALLASLLPAWRATRVRPLDAIAPRAAGSGGGGGPSWWLALVALPLMALPPVLSFVLPPGVDEPVALRLVIGAGALALGLFLLAPVVVRLGDIVAGPLLARLLGLPPQLLAQQLSVHLWRSVGCALSLSVGLGLFVAIQVWGQSMVQTFIPGPWAPDATVVVGPQAMTLEQARAVAQFPGVDPARCQPLVAEQPRLREDLTGSAEHSSVTRQNAVIVVGIDPVGAFGGDHPLIGGEWIAGSSAEAMQLMKDGRGCVVPDHFLRDTGLKIGDRFATLPPEDPTRTVEYVVAGAIRFDGWHWLTKMSGLRTRTHRAGALVIADYATVAADFHLPGPKHVWLRTLDGKVDGDALTAAARVHYATVVGKSLANADDEDENAPSARVLDTVEVGVAIRRAASYWLWLMSILPLIAMGISTIGVLNIVLAAVQARRWELGVLRAIGFTRGTLVRMVIAEGLVMGVVACVLGCAFGIIAGWSGTSTASVVSWFGGLQPVLVVPLAALAFGCVVLLVFAALAAVWPALKVGRTSPLMLLQQGREQG